MQKYGNRVAVSAAFNFFFIFLFLCVFLYGYTHIPSFLSHTHLYTIANMERTINLSKVLHGYSLQYSLTVL